MDIGVAQETALVLREDRGPVRHLTLNRPDKANTLSRAMMAALHGEMEAAAADAAIRVVVLGAAGRIFCAGHDLGEIRAHDDAAWHAALFAECSALMLLMQRLDKPVIACVQGAAVAGGCQLVAACDLAYAADSARFGVSGINLGLFCSTPSVPLSRSVGRKAAMEMLLTGELIDAARAARIGLINEAVPADRLGAMVEEKAALIAGKLAPALSLGKALFYRQSELDIEAAYAAASDSMVENLRLDGTRACIDGFLAKR